MRILSRAVLIVGGIVVLVAIGVLAYGSLEVWKQFIALSANRSRDFANPVATIAIGAGLTLVGGFLLGLALAMPKKQSESAAHAPVDGQPDAGDEAGRV